MEITEKLEVEQKTKGGVKYIFAPLKDKWYIETPEEIVRQSYICTLVNIYGYDLKQMSQEEKVNNSLRGQGASRADIVIWRTEQEKLDRKHAFIIVECKAENVKLQRGDYFQGANYASWAHAKFLVCINLKELKIFRTDTGKMPDEFLDEISDIPKAADINDEAAIKKILAQKKTFSKVDFQDLLLQCHDVFRDNDALAPDTAFDEISKILFMKINHERNRKIGEEERFTKSLFLQKEKWFEEDIKPELVARNPNDANLTYLDFWFNDTKRKYKKEKLFEQNDRIRISRESFLKVVEKLEAYNLSDTDDDIKGVAFEEFLSKTFRGKGLGQFFTPRTVVKFMTEILNPQEGEKICDPCCGSGGFLIYTFEYIKSKIEKDIEEQKERVKNELLEQLKGKEKLSEKKYQELEEKVTGQIEAAQEEINKDLDNRTKGTRLHHLSHECIFGTDKEARSARMAKMNMIMHGDGHGGVHQFEGLSNINGIKDGKFDVILTNPPFGSRVGSDLKDPNDNTRKLVENFDVSELSTLKEVMFTDRCINLLKKGGRLGIVLPEGVLNNNQLQGVREYFEGKAKILFIVSIPQDVFVASGATVKPSLLFVKKFTEEEEKEYKRITKEATKEVNEKYQPQIDEINKVVDDFQKDMDTLKEEVKLLKKEAKSKKTEAKRKAELTEILIQKSIIETEQKDKMKLLKADQKAKLKEIEIKKAEEIKRLVKVRFSYQIPIAEVEYAGIDSKGSPTKNELNPLREEFENYRTEKNLWEELKLTYSYEWQENKISKKVNNHPHRGGALMNPLKGDIFLTFQKLDSKIESNPV